MSWLWTFGRVPELDSAGINAVSQRIQAMSEKERVQPDAPRIIDVRTRREYEGGHIAGAVHASFLPPWSWPSSVAPVLAGGVEPGTPLFVICLSAHRSIGALKWLRERGYTNVQQLKGGMQAWRAAKMPEVTEAASVESGADGGVNGDTAGDGVGSKQAAAAGGCQAQTEQAGKGACAGGGCGSGAAGKECCGGAAGAAPAVAPAAATAAAGGGACCQKKKCCGGGGGGGGGGCN
ncbi:hypothetical protein HXX76_009678 [Chlamydomonas incerta]|uniref:Rhodanese domain-containing protein n=1 Tax=Chlamydomonas incerta TaxID=51695 RepID=A0A835SWE7_CHLIN|nr:hypothetical protein HXX76_009678 [Chlamydomonas incerta]|eukprot:KAG2431148.1 hypothetical protein HXX76_009678 [Chlamydomonas incerta]